MIRVTYNYVLAFVLFIAVTNADSIEDRFRILYSKNIKCDHNRSLNLDVSETRVYFYDFVNNINISSRIDNAADLLRKSVALDNSRRVIVFVPGYKSQIKRVLEELMRQTYKSVPNIYLIIIDHSAYTYENKDKFQSYSRSVQYAYYIGTSLGKFLADFCGRKVRPDNVHCIGHSLGSHIIGYAGETFTNITNEKLWRITGLDPAGPCFSRSHVEDHIRSGVGKYVEVYHCNAGYLGTTRTIADTDFFFNYEGKIQPNCDEGDNLEETVKCYHKACVKYWTKTVHNPELYLARSCPSYKAFSEGLCEENETTIAGCYNPGDARGIFYVSTNTTP
ncbi:phospholipase A1 4-like [Nymphalis io]|uniref:phospholipase A1 4-like n=1 Tax=Inachis io TaxID=171585 RepID=UPI0021681E1F|nr:phospholipase A1 4-like [Nymphalis io]